MSQYVDPYDVPKPSMPPPAYPGTNNMGGSSYQMQPQPNVVVMQEANVNVTVLNQGKSEPTTYVTQVNQVNRHDDDCGLGFCCGCCTAFLLCTVM